MSGTSLDGVDAALLETDGESRRHPGPALTVPYDPGLRADAARGAGRSAQTPPGAPVPAAFARPSGA